MRGGLALHAILQGTVMENQQEPVLVATPAQRTPGPATPGMDRQQAFATDGTWSGFVRTEAGMISGWHHHGDYETVIYVLRGGLKMEFGPNGSSTVEAILGTLSMCRRAPYTRAPLFRGLRHHRGAGRCR